MNEVYKVCRIDDGVFRSAYADTDKCRRLGLDLEYQPGVETRAPEGTVGIFCYDELAQAQTFADCSVSAYRTVIMGSCNVAILRCLTPHTPKPIESMLDFGTEDLWLKGKQLLQEPHDPHYAEVFAVPFARVVSSLTPIEVVP